MAKSFEDLVKRDFVHLLSYFDPDRHGAITRCARALGTNRAVVDRWRKYGISQQFIAKIAEFTAQDEADVRTAPIRARGSGAGGRPRKKKAAT